MIGSVIVSDIDEQATGGSPILRSDGRLPSYRRRTTVRSRGACLWGAAVDVDALAVHVAGAVGHDPAHDVGDVLRPADASIDGLLVHLVDVLAPRGHQPPTHLGLHEPGGDDVHVDALRALFLGERE